jgi:periplasmic protein TonB
LNHAPTAPETFPRWTPKEMGFPKAAGLSVILVLVISAFFYWASTALAPKPQPEVIQVTQAQLVQLPKPTPPPPPKVIPPPKPLPAIIPKPIPVPSKIVVATKPPPPIRHIYKPVAHPVVTHQPPPPVPVTHPAPPQPAPAVQTSGIQAYMQAMHAVIEQNQNVPPALAQLGISGTAIVAVTLAPNGRVISVRLLKSGGNALIDQTALAHASGADYTAFTGNMPSTPITIDVPVTIEPQSDESGDSDSDSN